jgi:hypothetical protein
MKRQHHCPPLHSPESPARNTDPDRYCHQAVVSPCSRSLPPPLSPPLPRTPSVNKQLLRLQKTSRIRQHGPSGQSNSVRAPAPPPCLPRVTRCRPSPTIWQRSIRIARHPAEATAARHRTSAIGARQEGPWRQLVLVFKVTSPTAARTSPAAARASHRATAAHADPSTARIEHRQRAGREVCRQAVPRKRRRAPKEPAAAAPPSVPWRLRAGGGRQPVHL